MADFYVNDYVIEVEGGHPGRREYHLIATPETWRSLLVQLRLALEEETLASNEMKNQRGETILFSKYATISKGETSRVYLSFYAANNLSVHHVPPAPPTWFDRFCSSVWGCGFIVVFIGAILYFASVGASEFVNKWMHTFLGR